MNLFKFFIFFFLIQSCISCAENRNKITGKTEKILATKNMSVKIYQTKNFAVFTAQKITDPKKNLRIYLEGDGKAYINEYMPSLDPTPGSYFFINLIAQDDYPNLIYIARPCQYIESKNCQEKYWTDARFSKEIIASIKEILQELSSYKLELIGYSGGAAIANYLAEQNKNIINIRTIAGNLDHEHFCRIHQVPDLAGSLAPMRDFAKLGKIPQIHFVGKKDKVIPPIIAEKFLQKFSRKNCIKIVEVEGATHSKGWQEKWAELLKIEPTCAN